MVLYLIAIIILIYYFSLEFNVLLRLSPTGRIVLLLLSCLIMYFGGLALTKYIDEKYKNKVLKINIGIWWSTSFCQREWAMRHTLMPLNLSAFGKLMFKHVSSGSPTAMALNMKSTK